MGVFLAIIILLFFGFLGLKYMQAKKNREIVTCSSCGNRMTRKRFSEGGCPRCGSDLFTGTGHLAR